MRDEGPSEAPKRFVEKQRRLVGSSSLCCCLYFAFRRPTWPKGLPRVRISKSKRTGFCTFWMRSQGCSGDGGPQICPGVDCFERFLCFPLIGFHTFHTCFSAWLTDRPTITYPSLPRLQSLRFAGVNRVGLIPRRRGEHPVVRLGAQGAWWTSRPPAEVDLTPWRALRPTCDSLRAAFVCAGKTREGTPLQQQCPEMRHVRCVRVHPRPHATDRRITGAAAAGPHDTCRPTHGTAHCHMLHTPGGGPPTPEHFPSAQLPPPLFRASSALPRQRLLVPHVGISKAQHRDGC